ncbi:RNase adapter RapZ [Sporosarcina luteola]|uniref:RNase adapter RapZ n=1 Tax=Sporosarcina luteola TaxID=582850 RepID=UPI00203F445B|nr:RNase adapter RapZ [Sporosarcina luteola]MCM3639356.1 RNase adapter RapZ [Sporosarcina luteola]MCM3711979.1 RNase adapter RapZ [Sporosarcina luteola]
MENELPNSDVELVIITGMSGAGKTVAMQSFEDLGFYCIDNLPPELLVTFLDLMMKSENKMRRIAAVMDTRGGDLFDALIGALDNLLKMEGVSTKLLFLDADDETLVRRYKETRRSHPLAEGGLPLTGIRKERNLLSELRGRARSIYNTSKLKPRELREKIMSEFSSTGDTSFTLNFISFGFKHGMPIDADVVFDVRFLPNPYYIEDLKPLTGLQKEVYEYVLKWNDTQVLIEKLTDLFKFIIPQYKNEGKSQVVVAFGCTGGQHRSVSLAEYFGNRFKEEYKTLITHRDVEKRKG